MRCLNLSLDMKYYMWTYLVLYSVKWKYWNDPCRENEILAYMVTILINMKVELVPWFKTWYLNLFGFKFGKIKVLKWPLSWSLNLSFYAPCCKHDMWTYFVLYLVKWKYWNDPCCENEILVYMRTTLINEMFELVPWNEILYVNLFGFVFRKIKVLEWPLSRKWDYSIYDENFDKYEGSTCPSMSLDA